MKKTAYIIWALGNLVLFVWFMLDKLLIRCEPCLDVLNCPPCQTPFMASFWTYITYWNLSFLVVFIVVALFLGGRPFLSTVAFLLLKYALLAVGMLSMMFIIIVGMDMYEAWKANSEIMSNQISMVIVSFLIFGVTFFLSSKLKGDNK